MELEIKLNFPAEHATTILAWLNSLPYGDIKLVDGESTPALLLEQIIEEKRFLSLYGQWDSDESHIEMYKRVRGQRYETPDSQRKTPPF